MNRTTLGYRDGEAFIESMERASAEGDAETIAQNMPRLEGLIARLMDKSYELASLQERAPLIRMQHEPTARERTRGT